MRIAIVFLNRRSAATLPALSAYLSCQFYQRIQKTVGHTSVVGEFLCLGSLPWSV
jgi:hypothetical protein